MKTNMGNADRFIRLLLGIAFAVAWFQHIITGIAGTIALIAGCIFIITAVVGICPLYNLLGVNTCARKKSM